MHSRPDTPSTFPLPRVKLIPDTHTHSQPDAHLTFTLPRIKSIPDTHTHSRPDAIQPPLFLRQIHSRHFIGLMTAVGRSPIVYLPRSMCLSPSFLAPYIYVPLRSSVTSLATLRSFSMSHPQFPVSVYPCFIYLYSLPLSPLLQLFRTFLTTHSRSFRSS